MANCCSCTRVVPPSEILTCPGCDDQVCVQCAPSGYCPACCEDAAESDAGCTPDDEEQVTITLRLPPLALSPNARVHHMELARTKKMYGTAAWTETLVALKGAPSPRWERATEQATFYWPTRGRHDKDNAAATLKVVRDAMVVAGLLADDEGLTPLPPIFEVDKDNPRVTITITKESDDD